MSETTKPAKKPKIYVTKSSAKRRETDYGDIIRISFKVEDAVKFFEEHKNEKGWINLDISERREESEFGDTHSISLNDWVKPTGDAPAARSKATTTQKKAAPATVAAPAGEDDPDDIPF